jgi:8-oxo-dGTP pyrophosphatase MutT (NUDIX family)
VVTREAVRQLLDEHEPYDSHERADLRRTSLWLESAPHPMDRTCYEPGHIVGSAFVVSDHRTTALVFHRGLGRWLQPGGHAEPGEHDPAEVAAREAREELGLASLTVPPVLFDVDIQEIPTKGSTPAHLHFDLRFLCLAQGELHAGSDATAAAWFTARELAYLDLDDQLRRMVVKAGLRGLLDR